MSAGEEQNRISDGSAVGRVLRAAFATSDGTAIDRHFGAAERFDIYEIDRRRGTARRIAIRYTDRACGEHQHHAQRIYQVADLLADCHCVFAQTTGPGAREVLEEHQIQAIDMEQPIEAVIGVLLHGRIPLVDPRYLDREPSGGKEAQQ